MPVSEQIKMLDGAGIILSAHGANLTNIGFMEEGANVIEMLPQSWAFYSIMQIAMAASLNYFGVLCSSINDHRDIIVNMDDLNLAFDEARSSS
jgi:capsular polysaccharide biosynthesis protein